MPCYILTGTVNPQSLVICFEASSCTGGFNVSTIADCCNNRVLPLGAAYILDGVEGCFRCPIGKVDAKLASACSEGKKKMVEMYSFLF